MLPNRPSDAGREPRRYNFNEQPCECANCGYPRTMAETYACQGNDACMERICEGCKQVCAYCGLPACSEHLERTVEGTACHLCIEHWRKCKGRCGCDPVETLAEAEKYGYLKESRGLCRPR